MLVGLPSEKTALFLVRDRLVFSQKYPPVNPTLGSGGALLAPQWGPGRNYGRNQTCETLPLHRRTQAL